MIASDVAAPDARAEHRRGQLLVALAATAWSTAGLLQRELTIDVPTQVGGRAAFAFVALLAYVAATERRRVWPTFVAVGRAGLGVAVCLAVASGMFIVSLNHTSVAHVLFVQAASPVAAALLGTVLLAEPVSRRAWAAMAGALAGVGVMMGSPGGGALTGDVTSLVMMLAFAVVIVITRRRKDVSMAPAFCLAQLLLVLVTAPLADPGQIGGRDLLLLSLIGAGQMGLAMMLFTSGARLIPAADAALITLLEVFLGPLWVWIALAEQPDAATLAGGAIVVAAVTLQVTAAPAERAVPPEV
jgi:drug/metabolite transporter (DMT)-like permease